MITKMRIILMLFLVIFTLNIYSRGIREAPKAQLDRTEHDFGLINPYYGKVETDFFLENKGNTVLTITNLSTSCSCTTVSSSAMELLPGEKANLHVIFDPLAHRGVSGQIRRVVYLETNDPKRPELSIELTGFVDFGDLQESSPGIKNDNTPATKNMEMSSTVFFNDACSMCVEYLNNELFSVIGTPASGNVKIKDYINETKNRQEMTELYRSIGVPPSLQSHILTKAGKNIFLGGHVAPDIISFLIETELPMERIYIAQDEMDNPTFYIAWDFVSEPETLPIDYPIGEYISNYNSRDKIDVQNADFTMNFLPLVLSGGFIDGVNPCAFSVLIFFIIFLFTMKRKRGPVIAAGLVFISAIYLSYLFIGLGIMQAFRLFENTHSIALISSGLLILMGLINIKDFFWYGKGISLSPNWIGTAFFKKNLTSLTILSTLIAGFIVGLCTFPCTGGIYVAILGILSTQTTFTEGLIYLILYNAAFVMPLVLILTFLTNRRTLGVLTRWENTNKRIIKLIMGILLILIGVLLIIWA